MDQEWIGIQSRGMKQWLDRLHCRTFWDLCQYGVPFPRARFWSVSWTKENRQCRGSRMVAALCPGRSSPGRLWRRLLCAAEWPAALTGPGSPTGYVEGDATGRKIWQLSRAVARIFDDYQVYRPDVLQRWAGPDTWEQEDIASGAAWQAWLWQHLVRDGKPLLAGLDRLILNPGKAPDNANTGGAPADLPVWCVFHAATVSGGL